MKRNASFYKFHSFKVANPSIFILCLAIFLGCKTVPVKREIREVHEISNISPTKKFIKSHMKDGTVYILYRWHFEEASNALFGYGSLLDLNRNIIETRGEKSNANKELFKVDLTQIALVETNDPGPSLAGGLGVVSGITGVFTIFCIANPKACFGSCPTFYAQYGDSLVLQAEGFSTSISPILEKNDIDMLYHVTPSKDFELVVTNEALETHSIRKANLLAFEKKVNERVFATPDGFFYKSTSISKPAQCQSQFADCLSKIVNPDHVEYYSLADENNLNSKEELLVTFEASVNKKMGLVIGKRQTLLTTFLMYQGLAYMGNSVTYWLAELEQGKLEASNGIFNLLGGIEVFRKDEQGNWKLEGIVNETGPIAVDYNLILLSQKHAGNMELKLRFNKGLWRIDYLALAELSEEVFPQVIKPYDVEVISGSEVNPLNKLVDDNRYLVTYPGDAYRLKYVLPFTNAELFLDSRGYYLEWIREEWVKEQNFRKLNTMINKPSLYLRKSARQYKKLEPTMEETFWNSRYVQK